VINLKWFIGYLIKTIQVTAGKFGFSTGKPNKPMDREKPMTKENTAKKGV